jgi:hypothetical protein
MSFMGLTMRIFWLGAWGLFMSNLDNYFGLVIMKGQICRFDQILDFK